MAFFFFSFHWKILREKISSLIIADIFSWTHFWMNVKRISIKVENTLRILEEVAFIGGREEAGRKRFWPPRFVSWGEKEHWLSAGNWTIAIGCFKCWNIYNIFFSHKVGDISVSLHVTQVLTYILFFRVSPVGTVFIYCLIMTYLFVHVSRESFFFTRSHYLCRVYQEKNEHFWDRRVYDIEYSFLPPN